ncbi:MAG TPA: hypothetical protein VMS21_15700 [Methylomirabilota bacterium]|nr:hypothetical protein [Methylomirabilota bacterium]
MSTLPAGTGGGSSEPDLEECLDDALGRLDAKGGQGTVHHAFVSGSR